MVEIDKIKPAIRELPSPGSVMYDFHFQSADLKKRKLKRWQRLNKYLIIPLYQIGILPLFGIGRIILILTTFGRKKEKKRKTPLEYRRFEGVITIFSAMGDKSVWVKNLHANPENVIVKHGFHHFKPRIEFITDDIKKISLMKNYVVKYRKSAQILFGWNPKEDDPEIADFSKLLNLLSIIQLHRKSN